MAGDESRSERRPQLGRQELEGGRLSRTVYPEQTEAFTARYAEREAVDGEPRTSAARLEVSLRKVVECHEIGEPFLLLRHRIDATMLFGHVRVIVGPFGLACFSPLAAAPIPKKMVDTLPATVCYYVAGDS